MRALGNRRGHKRTIRTSRRTKGNSHKQIDVGFPLVIHAVLGANDIGDQLGFTAGFAPEMLPAVIVGKLAGGAAAVAVALLLTRKEA